MPRIAHLLPNLVTGGRERMVADLCALSLRSGIEPVVISYDPDAPGERIPLPDIAHYAIDRKDAGFNAALHDLLMRENVDVLHAQGHIAGALAAQAMTAVPTIVSLHIALGQGWRWLPAIARGLRAAAAVTAVSADLARRFRPWANKPIAVVPPGIDLSRHRPVQRRDHRGPLVLGIAARLHPVKRHRDIFVALELLRRRGHECRLLVAGQGPEEPQLRRAAEGLAAGGVNVEFHGDVRDMPAWLSGLDTFILPSDHEGTPLALLEALATGLPCIATAVGGMPQVLADAGLLVPRRNPQAIGDAIERLIVEPGLRPHLADAAVARAQAFSLERRAAPFLDLYRTLG